MDSYRARVRFLRGGGLLLAALLFGTAFLFFSAGSASAAEPEPPDVKSGSAQSNCQRIVDAGFSTDDYVLSGGKWQHRPDWTGADGARMSRIWGSVTICRGEYSLELAPIRYQPTQTFYNPTPSYQGGGASQTVSRVTTDPKPIIRTEQTVEQRYPDPEPRQAQTQTVQTPAPRPRVNCVGGVCVGVWGQYAGRRVHQNGQPVDRFCAPGSTVDRYDPNTGKKVGTMTVQ